MTISGIIKRARLCSAKLISVLRTLSKVITGKKRHSKENSALRHLDDQILKDLGYYREKFPNGKIWIGRR